MDDLVKRLRHVAKEIRTVSMLENTMTDNFRSLCVNEGADRIVELEAKLAEATAEKRKDVT